MGNCTPCAWVNFPWFWILGEKTAGLVILVYDVGQHQISGLVRIVFPENARYMKKSADLSRNACRYCPFSVNSFIIPGLSLPICHDICKKHACFIAFQEAWGMVFTIMLGKFFLGKICIITTKMNHKKEFKYIIALDRQGTAGKNYTIRTIKTTCQPVRSFRIRTHLQLLKK